MSLVVCSNKLESKNPYDRFGLDQSASRFRNHLVNTLEIPANSEVAVQSVKVNKDGLMKLTQYDRWFQFFNQNCRTNTDDPLISDSSLSTGMPIMCTANMIGDESAEYVNANEFVNRMTTGMKLGFPHPDIDVSNTKAQVLRLGATIVGAGFEGFRMTYDYLSTATTNLWTTDWSKLTEAYAETSTMTISEPGGSGTATRITCDTAAPPQAESTGLNHNVAWANEYPISHSKGEINFKLDGLVTTGVKLNGGWAVGLSRTGLNDPGSTSSTGQIPYGSYRSDGFTAYNHHYDYVVYSEQNIPGSGNPFYMKVGHFVANADDPTEAKPCRMEEIIYYDDVDGNFTGSEWTPPFVTTKGPYNLSTNIQHFDNIRFKLQNEIMTIEIMSSTGTGLAPAIAGQYYTICSYSLPSSKSAPKMSVPNPAGQTCWNIYPKVMLRTATKFIDIDTSLCRDTGYKAKSEDGDWYYRMMNNAQARLPMEIDTRHYNDQDDTTFYVQRDTSSTGTSRKYSGYENIVILTPDTIRYLGTGEANMQHRLGYIARGILDSDQGTTTLQEVYFDSDVTPSIIDYSSQFVRLDNFTQLSHNAGTGRPSKILYHMPRFDTSNREIGTGLYFEPQERVYIKLNNTESIPANEFHLSICDNTERIVEDLTGQTIICLHVRKSDKPLNGN